MIKKHFTDEKLSDYFENGLPVDETVRLFTHLETCQSCAQRFDILRAKERSGTHLVFNFSLIEDEASAHLDFNEIEAFVDGSIERSELELLNHHLKTCLRCSEALSSYRAEKEFALPNNFISSEQPASLFIKIKRSVSLLFASSYLSQSFTVFVCLMIIGIIFWIWLDMRKTGEGAALVRVEASSLFDVMSIAFTKENIDSTNNEKDLTVKTEHDKGSTEVVANPVSIHSKHKLNQPLIIKDMNGPIVLSNLRELKVPEDIPASLREDVIAALNGKIVVPSALILKEGIPIKTRGSKGDNKLQEPVRLIYPLNKTIRTDKPNFQWRPHKEATLYKVIVVDDYFNVVAESPMLAQTHWQIDIPLKRDGTYHWQVRAYKNNEELNVAPNKGNLFSILSDAKAFEIVEAEQNLKSHLALGLIYLKNGLIDEAKKEFCKLQKLNPRSRQVKELLSQVCKLNSHKEVKLRCYVD